jgi:hypothetical protein
MADFLDVTGASGGAYRFRRVASAELPATAGNLLVASGLATPLRILLSASADSLTRTASVVKETLAANPDAGVFIRLNVARAIRDAEYADVVAAVHPETQVADLD